MSQDNKKYIIYKHTNLKNNKIYIGQTCQKPQNRWGKEGAGYKGQMFYSAIQKYGWNNFSHEILYTNLSLEEANYKEAELIQKYQTTNPQYGYNIEKGGNNKFSFQIGKEHPKSKQVICLNTQQIFDTEKDAAIWMNQDPYKSHIAEACQNKRLFCGIHPETKEPLKWMYLDEYSIEKSQKRLVQQRKKDPKIKKIQCINNGMIFETMQEAMKWAGLKTKSGICMVCQNKRNYAGKDPVTKEKLSWRYYNKEEEANG